MEQTETANCTSCYRHEATICSKCYGVHTSAKIRVNQLPVSAARWQPGYQIYLTTFIKRTSTNLPITQQPVKFQKNKHRIGILKMSRDFKCIFD